MRKYYIFNIIDKESYYNDQDILYKLLYTMYNMQNLNYGIVLYNRICKIVDISCISNYLENKYKIKRHKNKYLLYNHLIELNKSHIVIKSKINIPKIFNILNIYSKNFFVIDFKNEDYFWLDDILKQLKIK